MHEHPPAWSDCAQCQGESEHQLRIAGARLCRNGHDLAKVGKWVETPTRPRHVQCTTCRRAQRVREHAVRRQDRAIARLRRARDEVKP